MFEQNVTNTCTNGLVSSVKSDKNIILSFSLLMRLFEWCHEEAKNDVAMHKMMEKIVAFNDGINPLTIDTYDVIVANANDGQESDKEDCENVSDDDCEKHCDDIVEPMKCGQFSEIDMSNVVQPVQAFDIDGLPIDVSQPYQVVMSQDEEPCQQCCEPSDVLSDDMQQEIEQIINAGRL